MTEVMQQVHQQVKAKLEATNAKYKVAIDLHRKLFEVGDLVWVLISKDRKLEGQYAKLRLRKYGPCRVLKRISNMRLSYLPTCLSLIFSMCWLAPYHGPTEAKCFLRRAA